MPSYAIQHFEIQNIKWLDYLLLFKYDKIYLVKFLRKKRRNVMKTIINIIFIMIFLFIAFSILIMSVFVCYK